MTHARISEHTQPAVGARPRARRWRMPWVETIASLVIISGLCLFLYPHAASWFSQKEQSRVTALALEKLDKPPHNTPKFLNEHLERAHDYNDVLASGAVLKANENIAVGTGGNTDGTLNYNELLNTTETGYMGRLLYEGLQIDLPIYHGTNSDTLLKGIGHLEGTSLPVGGIDTRSVLTAHRGLPEATLFNELNRAKVGDTFTISVLDQVLTYRVIETLVIEPDQTEAILPIVGNDVVSLITCTPLGINSHRILVNAERITPTPIRDIEVAKSKPELPGFPWWSIALGGTVVAAAVFIWRSGIQPSKQKAKTEED